MSKILDLLNSYKAKKRHRNSIIGLKNNDTYHDYYHISMPMGAFWKSARK